MRVPLAVDAAVLDALTSQQACNTVCFPLRCFCVWSSLLICTSMKSRAAPYRSRMVGSRSLSAEALGFLMPAAWCTNTIYYNIHNITQYIHDIYVGNCSTIVL